MIFYSLHHSIPAERSFQEEFLTASFLRKKTFENLKEVVVPARTVDSAGEVINSSELKQETGLVKAKECVRKGRGFCEWWSQAEKVRSGRKG